MLSHPVITVTLNPAIDQTLSIPGFAAGRVNRVAGSGAQAGGKGVNVACVLSDLGLEAVATGFLGTENAEPFESAFDCWGIADQFIRIAGHTRAGIKIVDGRTQQTTDINFPGLTPTEEEISGLFERIAFLAEPGRWFVLSGSVPAGVPDGIYAGMIESIHRRGGHVVLDTCGPPLREALASRPEVMKPNVDELGELAGRALDTHTAVRAAAESLLARGVGRVVVSMGGDGALFVDGGQALLARPPTVTVRSTVGAGDAMVGGIVYAQIHELDPADAARLATACGACAVTRIGAGIGDPAGLWKLVAEVEIETMSER